MYEIAQKNVEFIKVQEELEQRNYFCFNNYEYYLDVSKQYEFMADVRPLEEGLAEALKWSA